MQPLRRTVRSDYSFARVGFSVAIPSVWQAQQLELWRSTMVKDAHGAGKDR